MRCLEAGSVTFGRLALASGHTEEHGGEQSRLSAQRDSLRGKALFCAASRALREICPSDFSLPATKRSLTVAGTNFADLGRRPLPWTCAPTSACHPASTSLHGHSSHRTLLTICRKASLHSAPHRCLPGIGSMGDVAPQWPPPPTHPSTLKYDTTQREGRVFIRS